MNDRDDTGRRPSPLRNKTADQSGDEPTAHVQVQRSDRSDSQNRQIEREGGLPSKHRLDVAHDVAEIVQAVAATAALGAAAWWFLHQRLSYPHANITHSVQSLKIAPGWTLIALTVHVRNAGVVPVSIDNGTIYIQRVLPLDSTIAKDIAAGKSPIDPKLQRVVWPTIGDEYKTINRSEISPGEQDSETYDFIIPDYICEVALYSSYADEADRGWDWSASTYYRIKGCNHEK